MLLLAVGSLAVVPWCGWRDVGASCIGDLFQRRGSTAFATLLMTVNSWYSFVGTSSSPYMCESCPCCSFGLWIDIWIGVGCLAIYLQH